MYIIAANRVGEERSQRFIGRSQISDPSGVVLAEADADSEQIILADISVEEARNKRFGTDTYHVDILDDRRPDLYGGLDRSKTSHHFGGLISREPPQGAVAKFERGCHVYEVGLVAPYRCTIMANAMTKDTKIVDADRSGP